MAAYARRRRPLLLAHLFAAPLVKETTADVCGEEHEPGLTPVKQQNYVRERDVITRTLATAERGFEFRSEVASEHNFLMNLTGCRVLHFTWNGDQDQEQVMFEDKRGLASFATEEWFNSVCSGYRETLPELVVLSAASAKRVAGAFIRAGISNVVAIETSNDDTSACTLDFVRAFYHSLAHGHTLQDSFDAGMYKLPQSELDRCALLPPNGDHFLSPFDDATSRRFTNLTPRLPGVPSNLRSTKFLGRETKVHEVYMHMVQNITVITIKGPPGIGKTEVALWACEYARERRLFEETFFVSLQEEGMGAPITALKDVSARIARAFGISEKEVQDHPEGFLGCIQQKCSRTNGDLLLVLDGCSPLFVHGTEKRITLSSVVEQLCQRASNLHYIVTVVTQVGIAKEKVVNIGRLSELAAAELFVATAPREVTMEELRGGMLVSGHQVQDAGCMRLFAGGVIMTLLDGHPGAIIAASGKLKDRHLLTHEDEFQQVITVQLQRYGAKEQDFMRQLQEGPQTQSDFFIENLWGGRQARRRGNFHPSVPPPRRETPAASVSGQDGDRSNGEFWWRQALERHTGIAGAISQTIPWEALCHSLATYFLEVLGEEGRDRPLQPDEFQTLGCRRDVWHPHPPLENIPGVIVTQESFLGSFWPWFKAATQLLKRTGYWGFQKYPVMCRLTTTRADGQALLQGKPAGTFLLRLSSVQGSLAVMYVKADQQVGSILIRGRESSSDNSEFEMDIGRGIRGGSLKYLISTIPEWKYLFPDTPKHVALGVRR